MINNIAVFKQEIRYWLSSPLYYVLSIAFFAFAFLSFIGTGGYFDGVQTSTEQTIAFINTPYAIAQNSFLFTKAFLFFTAILMGYALYRDHSTGTFEVLYTYPIKKVDYLLAKFGSALVLMSLSAVLLLLGLLVGELLLGTGNPKVTSFNSLTYGLTFGVYLLPTLITIGTFIFVAVGCSRQLLTAFITALSFLLAQLLLTNVFFSQPNLLALLDPFAQYAFEATTSNWDFSTKNSEQLPISTLVLWNRLLWLAISAALLGWFYHRFDFQYEPIISFPSFTLNKLKKTEATKSDQVTTATKALVKNTYKKPLLDFSIRAKLKALFYLAIQDLKYLISSKAFVFLSVLSIATVFFIQLRVCNTGDFVLYPITRLLLAAPLSLYSIIIIISTFLYSGMLVNRDRAHKMQELVGACAVNNWQVLGAKLTGVAMMQMLQLFLFFVVCIGIQLLNGYHQFEFGQYAFHLLFLLFPSLLIWNLTSCFAHTLSANFLVGLTLLLGLWFGIQALPQLGLRSLLFQYNTPVELSYSDFNGYGHQLLGFGLNTLYWLCAGAILLFATRLLWIRANVLDWKERARHLSSRTNTASLLLLSIFLLSFLGLGYVMHQAEIEDQNLYPKISKSTLANYKKTWQQYDHLALPAITDILLHIDLYPEDNRMQIEGQYLLVNTQKESIDTLLIHTGFDEMTNLNIDQAELIQADSSMQTYMYRLHQTLQEGDSLLLKFNIQNKPNTYFSRNSNVLANGTFIKQDVLPRLSYRFQEQQAALSDMEAAHNHFYHRDADLVHLTTNISTNDEQLAFAPGVCREQFKQGGRNHFRYETPQPVKLNFSFHSGEYAHLSETHHGIKLNVYTEESQTQNAALMLEGLKAALDYNATFLGNYPYEDIRIIAFPHTEESYTATLTTNNIPTSEVLFNINIDQMADKVQLPFYVMAHELTHEWFGNQVMPAGVEGAKMLTESITEYISLCIYRDHFGEELLANFIDIQYQRYQNGLKKEKQEEMPLYKVKDHQQYIAYGKGSVALYRIAQQIGEAKMKAVLKEYLSTFKAPVEHYPTTIDFINILKKHTEDAQHPFIESLLMTTDPFILESKDK